MARRKIKGATVYFDYSLKQQLLELLKNMELTEEEVIEVMKSTTLASANAIQSEINSILKKHNATGETISHAIKPEAKVEKIGDSIIVSADVGVRLSENLNDMKKGDGGYGALLIDYGTPKGTKRGSKRGTYKKDSPKTPKTNAQATPRAITNAIRRGRTKAEKTAVEAYTKAVERRLGKK